MRIAHITAGAGHMYCGSCLRDNVLAAALLDAGHQVVLIPTYTPTRPEGRDVSLDRVFMGGINVFLQEHVPFFRRTPRFLNRLLDAAPLLRLATRRGVSVNPRQLGRLTVSMLRGADGAQHRPVLELIRFLADDVSPEIVSIPNSLLIALAPAVKRELGVPVVCTLQGEDGFLDSLREPFRGDALRLIREHAASVDAFVAVSEFGADRMSAYLGIDRSRVHVVPLGVDVEGHARAPLDAQPFTIGYLARVAPEKGLHVLCEAYRRLRARPGCPPSRLLAAGYLPPQHKDYLRKILEADGLVGAGRAPRVPRRARPRRQARLPADPQRFLGSRDAPQPEGAVRPGGDGQRRPRRAAPAGRVHGGGGEHGRGNPDRPRRRRRPRAWYPRPLGKRRAEETARSGRL